MKIPSFKRIIKQDYDEEYRNLIDKLASSLNIGIETLYNLANNRISLTDNIAAVRKSFQIQVDATGKPISGTTNISFGSTITGVAGTKVIRAQNVNNPASYVVSAPFISYTQNGTSIDINNITGLPANQTFLLTVELWE